MLAARTISRTLSPQRDKSLRRFACETETIRRHAPRACKTGRARGHVLHAANTRRPAVHAGEMLFLQGLAAEKKDALSREEEIRVFAVYKRVIRRMQELDGRLENPGSGAKTQKMKQEIRWLADAKRLGETIVDHAMDGLIWWSAKHLRFPKSISIEDLVQEGKLALITKSMRTFNPTRGYRFSTYGLEAVKQAMARLIKDHCNMMQTAYISDAAGKVRRASESRCDSTENEPTIEEIADSTGLSEITIKRCLSLPRVVSIYERADGRRKSNLIERSKWIDLIPDKTVTNPLDMLLQNETGPLVGRLLATLKPDVEEMVRKSYGVGCEKHTHAEIAEGRGFCRERARQIIRGAILRLHKGVLKAPDTY